MQKKLHTKRHVKENNLRHLFYRKDAKLPGGLLPIPAATVQLLEERASGVKRFAVLGSTEDVESIGYEALLPSLVHTQLPAGQPRIKIGGPQCLKPYEASVLNCSALSFGPMSKNFILAINQAAAKGGFFQNTGEAGLSPYHFGVDVDIETPDFRMDAFMDQLASGAYPELEAAGDLVWQIGTGYFGCRTPEGGFDAEQFAQKAAIPNVKMIELKVSQGVQPRKEMPVREVTPGIAKVLGIPSGEEAKLQNSHVMFANPLQLLAFIQQLRQLSGGKPVGIKMGLSHKRWFLALCKAMRKSGILLDFITIDGMEAGTAAAAQGTLGYTGTPLNDAILYIHNSLTGVDLRSSIKLIASGKVLTERDMISKLARGADLCATARGFMLSVGCDQQGECYKGNCPKGIATQDAGLMAKFSIKNNSGRALNYHSLTIAELKELLSVAGVSHPDEIGPFHVQKRVSVSELKTLDEIYEFIPAGSLLSPWPWGLPERFRKDWRLARADMSFSEMLAAQAKAVGR